MNIICLLQNQCTSSEGACAGEKSSFKKVKEAFKDWMADAKEEVLKSNIELVSGIQEENGCLAKSNEELQSLLTKQEEENIKLKDDNVKQHEKSEAEFSRMTQCNEELKTKVTKLITCRGYLNKRIIDSASEVARLKVELAVLKRS